MEQPEHKLRFGTRLALAALFLRELLRAALVPWRLLWSLPHGTAERRRNRELVGSLDLEQTVEGTKHARCFFRARRDARPIRRLLISCGEASGEHHAIALIKELRRAEPSLEVHAFGGEALGQLPGVTLHVNLVDRAVLGLSGALSQLPFFMRAVGIWIQLLRSEKPDAVVLVDNPGLHLVLAERAARLEIPVLYFICPQYWAWASWRMKRFAQCVDAALAILPFEAPLFAAAGVPCGFAGHPMLETAPPALAEQEREELLVLLPGSRRKELQRHAKGMLQIALALQAKHSGLRIVIPQSQARHLEWLKNSLPEAEDLMVLGEPKQWLAKAKLALVKSGTSTMECAIAGTPMVICYQLTGLFESFLLRTVLRSPWFGAPNLVLGEEIVPEFVFRSDEGWNEVQERLEQLLEHAPLRQAQAAGLERVRQRLSGPGAPKELRHWLLD
ncbi:MAG: hypothetical protein CSA62_00855 [Planctomycetota bacterium]|nr:MAG: hypothetical protein CSA62_00855 [Planctomycetota bacterium]